MAYYAIGIGGTGAKCIESLIHLVAAGLMPDNERLYVLFVDPDKANGSLSRANDLLKCYHDCRQNIIADTDFLKTPIEISDPDVWSPLADGVNQLDEFITYNNLKTQSEEIAHLFDVLYSPEEKTTSLDKGFRGHPSIGAAVMASSVDLENAEPWKTFWKRIEDDNGKGKEVKVMLFGSIFGGTGASGFPTIARLLHDNFKAFKNPLKFQIGGVLMLPYFSFSSIENAGMQANAKDFLLNTQSALNYYSQQDNLKIFDSVYLVGSDDVVDMRVSAIGGQEQENQPHFTELYSGLAAVEFFSGKSAAKGDNRYQVTARELIVEEGNVKSSLRWTDLPADTNELQKKILQLIRFSFAYLSTYYPALSDIAEKGAVYRASWYVDFFSKEIDVKTRIQHEFDDVKKYCESFLLWFANLEFSVTNSPTTSENLLNFAPFAYVREVGSNKHTVEHRQSFDNKHLDNFEKIKPPGMEAGSGLADLWERMCEARPRTSDRNTWLFINELYRQCGNAK